MLQFNSIMIGTTQLQMLAMFYEKVFGRAADRVDSTEAFFSWSFGDVALAVFMHSKMSGDVKEPGRVMINYETTQVQEEFERIRSLGGRVVAEPYAMGDGWIATLADPDGNYFQLISPSLD